MKGEMLKAILEDVADNAFNPDPYYQQGGDMVRVGGMGYTVNIDGRMGERITSMYLVRSGAPILPDKEYVVAGWGSVNEAVEGPPIWQVVASHLEGRTVVRPEVSRAVKFVRAGG
jgi:sulfur-oxidizing protein SoxB